MFSRLKDRYGYGSSSSSGRKIEVEETQLAKLGLIESSAVKPPKRRPRPDYDLDTPTYPEKSTSGLLLLSSRFLPDPHSTSPLVVRERIFNATAPSAPQFARFLTLTSYPSLFRLCTVNLGARPPILTFS